MTIIDPSSPTPLYEQLKFIIQDQILNGEYRQGSHLPSESTLCEKYGISRITVSRALTDLENDGILQRVQGSGTIVNPYGEWTVRLAQGFSENMKMYGKKVTSKILSIDNIPADEAILKTFRLGSMEEESFIRFRRLRYVDGVPGAIMTSIVRSWVGTKMQEYDLEKASFYTLYQEITHLPVVRSETTLYPIVASPEISELLYVKQGSPHFLLLGTGFLEGDIPIEYSISVSNGSLFQFSTTLYKLRESNYAQYASKDLL